MYDLRLRAFTVVFSLKIKTSITVRVFKVNIVTIITSISTAPLHNSMKIACVLQSCCEFHGGLSCFNTNVCGKPHRAVCN